MKKCQASTGQVQDDPVSRKGHNSKAFNIDAARSGVQLSVMQNKSLRISTPASLLPSTTSHQPFTTFCVSSMPWTQTCKQ